MGAWLNPIQRWVWGDPVRRGYRLLRFSEVEADSGRDMTRAAEVTDDARLRGLYLRHARDEQRHADLFRRRGIELLRAHAFATGAQPGWQPDWLAPGERGLDDVKVVRGEDGPLLAFVHISERTATKSFATYRRAMPSDRDTCELLQRILRDETFHMTYTRNELARIAPSTKGWLLFKARLGRLWKSYLRFAVAFSSLAGGVILTVQYFLLLPPFAWAAKRAERREPQGWVMAGEAVGRLGGEF